MHGGLRTHGTAAARRLQPSERRLTTRRGVGVDSVDVAAAPQKCIPVTNCPDTFIDEVVDHAMTLILASYRRLVSGAPPDQTVRSSRIAFAAAPICGHDRGPQLVVMRSP